jgi:hypothetical protein
MSYQDSEASSEERIREIALTLGRIDRRIRILGDIILTTASFAVAFGVYRLAKHGLGFGETTAWWLGAAGWAGTVMTVVYQFDRG